MDALTLALAVAGGTAAGLATGLLPGVHVNTVCAVALPLAGALGPAAAVGLCAMGVAHAAASSLPSAYLGAPGEETLLSALPAHRMLLAGRGPDAVQAGLDGTLAGLAAATALVLPYKWLLGEPLRLLGAIDAAMAWILGGIAVLLVARERRRGARAVAWALVVLLLSGALGWLGGSWPVEAIVPVAATPLLPMLSGLFGAPALLETLRAQPAVPAQQPPARPPPAVRRACRQGVVAGTLAAAATAVLPGLTSSIGAAVAQTLQRRGAGGDGGDGGAGGDARPMLTTLAAIAGAHVVLTFVVLWLSLQARTGLAVGVQRLWPVEAWSAGAAPLPLRLLLLAALAAGLLAHLGTSAMAGPAARWLPRLPQRAVSAAALAAMAAVVLLFSGAWGLALFAVATTLGLLPLAAGLGRVHLTGCLLLPVLAHRLGAA